MRSVAPRLLSGSVKIIWLLLVSSLLIFVAAIVYGVMVDEFFNGLSFGVLGASALIAPAMAVAVVFGSIALKAARLFWLGAAVIAYAGAALHPISTLHDIEIVLTYSVLIESFLAGFFAPALRVLVMSNISECGPKLSHLLAGSAYFLLGGYNG